MIFALLFLASSATNGNSGGTTYTAGSGITISGASIAVTSPATGTNTGDVTLGTVGSTPANAGASLSGQVLTLQPADGTHGGVIAASGAQTLGATLTTGNTFTISSGNLVTPCYTLASNGHIDWASGGCGPIQLFATNTALALDFENRSTGGSWLHLDSTTGNGKLVVGTGDTGVEFLLPTLTGISAAGSSQSDCTQLTTQFSNVTTVGSGQGVCLPKTNAGAEFTVHTSGANSLLIYTNAAGGTINGQSSTTGITIVNTGGTTPGSRVIKCYSTTICFASATLPDTN